MIWKVSTFFVVAFVGGSLGAWIKDRDVPTTQVRSPEVLTPTLPPGGTLLIRYSLVRSRSCAVKTERLLFDADGVRYPLEDIVFDASPGPLGPDSYTSRISIPRSFAQGQGRYRTISTYVCNLVHKWFWPIAGQPSDVLFRVDGLPLNEELPIKIIPLPQP